jgi:hypothetical protein
LLLTLTFEFARPRSKARSKAKATAAGRSARSTHEQVWLSASQGLRGSFPALSGAGKSGLPHWKPGELAAKNET